MFFEMWPQMTEKENFVTCRVNFCNCLETSQETFLFVEIFLS